MRKNINKLVAFAIGISVMSGSIVPAFAADENQTATSNVEQTTSNTTTGTAYRNIVSDQSQVKQKPILTLKEAIDAAINNSDKLALQAKQIKLYQDQLDIQEALDDFKDSDDNFPYDKLELMIKQSKEQKEYMKDQIAQDITNKYNDLVTKQNALAKLKKQLDVKTKQFSDTTLKQKLGLATSIDIQNAQNDLQTFKNSITAKENQLKNSQDYFKVLTEKDLDEYTLEQDQDYEAFRIEGSQDEYFDKVIDKYLKYNKKILDLTKDNLKDNEVDKPDSGDKPDKSDYYVTDPTTGAKTFNSAGYAAAQNEYAGKWNTYGQYLQNKFSASSSQVTLDETKKSLKDGLKQSYASLLDMENTINVMKSNMQVKNKELSIAKLKYDMGLMTKADYDTQVIANDDLETTLRTTINSYNDLKDKIQKPWLLAGGSSSASAGASASTGA